MFNSFICLGAHGSGAGSKKTLLRRRRALICLAEYLTGQKNDFGSIVLVSIKVIISLGSSSENDELPIFLHKKSAK